MPWIVQHRRSRAGVLLLVSLALATVSGCGKRPGRMPAVAARIGAYSISIEDVDRRIREELFEAELGHTETARLHERRLRTLDAMIDDYLLEREARAAGLTPAAWLERAVAKRPPIRDEQVEVFFESHRSDIGEGVTLDELAPRIRAHLEGERQLEVLERLRARAGVEIRLERARAPVSATGPSRGPENAIVTLVEWSDFQCPYCARAEPTLETLLERHAGEIRIVYRHLPLSFHAQARQAAEAAVCAEEQRRFWDYHHLLFRHQHALSRDDLLGYAHELDLDIEAFTRCVASPETADLVQRDIDAAGALGVTATPSFFVNGIPVRGAQPIEVFEELIQAELARPR